MTVREPYAVLTGDIVASQKLGADGLERARAVLEEACAPLGQWSPGLLPREIDFSRGDAWQLLIGDPARALRAALWLRSALLHRCGVDTRIAVGIGAIEPLAAQLSRSGGEAFVLSGRSLDAMRAARLSIVLPPGRVLGPWVGLTARLCDAIVCAWTRRQAELVHASLPPQAVTQSAIAAGLRPPVTKQAVGKGLRAANWDAVAGAIATFEAEDWPRRVNECETL